MEFLMTYGWAILIAIIIIGILAYFGVFNPGKNISSQTTLNAPFYAKSWNADTKSFNIELIYNGKENQVNVEITLENIKSMDRFSINRIKEMRSTPGFKSKTIEKFCNIIETALRLQQGIEVDWD